MKKSFCLLLSLLMLLALYPASALAEAPEAETVEEDTPPVVIDSLDAFLDFASCCCLESYSKDRVFSLETDLDLSGADFAPIPFFAGIFLGNGHCITNLDISCDGSRLGLFRQIAAGAAVRELSVQGKVAPGGTRLDVGGIAGLNAGSIEDCAFRGSAAGLENVGGIVGTNEAGGAIVGCRFDGEVRAEHQSGGIVGLNSGTISDCRSAGGVNTVQIIPERRQSFDLSAFSEDDFLDLSNIGGIAGQNGGVISGCLCEAAVGYAYTGYNVGGIAGKSAGFITACENLGNIQGRRDVGGIVGQLIPHAVWDFSEGRLNGLNDELQRLNELLAAASRNAQNRSATIQAELQGLRGSTADALDELSGVLSYYRGGMTGELITPDTIGIDPTNSLPELPEVSLTDADLSGLSGALDRVYAQSLALSDEIGAAAGSVSEDLLAVNAQLSRVLDCMSLMLGGTQDETLFESYDLSADETYEHDLGAVDACKNAGNIEGESSAGGIAGSMAFELSFDMEDRLRASDFITSDARRYLFAALRGCEHSGEVSVRADCAGGLVGRAEAGAVVDCVCMGSVSSQKGDYVGGVAGSSGGSIRACWARVELRGGKYVGGIAGTAQHILNCAVWAELEGGTEYLGAVAGWAEGEIRENRYVDAVPAGIDGVSRIGQCEPVSAEELLALDGVPKGFGELQIRFFVGNRLVETRTLPFGGSLDELPAVPDDGPRRWEWDDFDRGHLTRNMDISGRYTAPLTTLSSGEELPLFLVEGQFAEGQSLRVASYEAELPEEELLAAYTLAVEGYEGALTVRLRAEDGGRLCLVGADGTLSVIPYEVDKSYLVFSMDNGASFVYLRQTFAQTWLPWALGGGAAAVLLIAGALLIRRRRKKAAAVIRAAEEEKA